MLYKTHPFAHQRENTDRYASSSAHGLLWEQGTGKSKTTIDHAVRLAAAGQIDAVLVVAPNGVHTNWVTDELPAHCAQPYLAHAWSSRRASTQAHQREADRLIRTPKLSWLCISYDAIMTKRGRKFADEFAGQRNAMCVLDESQRIKSPGAKRTKSLAAFGRRFRYKRILSGTPVTNKPFDIYSQIRFLDWDFWKRRGFASVQSFKTYFGIWEERLNTATGRKFPYCVEYRNLDRLRPMVAELCSRVRKADVLDLPPKIYTKRYVELEPKQRKLYQSMRDDFLVYLDSGEMLAAPIILTRLLRLQQILCGYIPNEDGEIVDRFDPNPRLKALLDLLEDVDGKAIIFARFREDIRQICEALGSAAVRYDGQTSEASRLEARERFQAECGPRFFVGNPAACGTGLTLHRAQTVVYYSNSFNLEHRLQSEDRAHRIGQTSSVRYVDLVTPDSIDFHLVTSLRSKLEVANVVVGDAVKAWL